MQLYINLGSVSREEAERRIHDSMPFSSGYFLSFKWWSAPGIDAAIWMCQKKVYDATNRHKLGLAIKSQPEMDWTIMMVKTLALGKPSVIERLKMGVENIWITDLTVCAQQKIGKFPELFQDAFTSEFRYHNQNGPWF